MPTPGSASSDYYGDDDPEFLQALNEVSLDGQLPSQGPIQTKPEILQDATELELPPASQPSLKRRRAVDDAEDEPGSNYHQVLKSVDADDEGSYLSSHTYGASRFGEFGEYMARKRAKLQIQNAEMDTEAESGTPRIFRGLQIYINGWTEPSVQDLRQLIIQHGGIYHPYLDKKSLVTHIITCSLTPAKIREFKHMKVVRPEWLMESAKAGQLLPWHDFIFKPGDRLEPTQGRRVAQKSLFEGFVSQNATRPTGESTSSLGDQPRPVEKEKSADDSQPVAGPSRLTSDMQPDPITPPQTPKKKAGSISPPLYTTDPSTPEQAVRVPDYASDSSNRNAERAMADPAWRAAHTSVAPDFVQGYYKNSRLHHLSTWKAELKDLVAEAQERAEKGDASTWGRLPSSQDRTAVEKIVEQNIGRREREGEDDVSMRGAQLVMRSPSKGKGKERAVDSDEDRVIMHCDFDSFFVSAGLIDRPDLRGKPVVVCHSQGGTGGASSTSEIASASYEARKFDIKSGMSLQQARKLCPTLLTIPYEFKRYKQLSLQFYTILMAHADDLQAVSVDEALIDVTSSVRRINSEIAKSQDPSASPADPARDFAEVIRVQVKKATGCEVSIGIAHNVMLARVASRKAKPAGSLHILPQDAPEILATLDIDDLHGFGYSARQKALEKLGATTLGELAKKSKAVLCEALGKGTGETLYKAIRGIDDHKLESDKPRKSVSCDINYGIRFENNEQAEAFIYQVSEEVSRRLNNINMKGRSLTLKILTRDPTAPVEAPKFMGHGICESFNKQTPLIAPGGRATSDELIIGEHAWRLLKSFNFDPKELRGIGIQIQKLEKTDGETTPDVGQAVLPFRPKAPDGKEVPTVLEPAEDKAAANPAIVVQPPSQDDDEIQIIDLTETEVVSINAEATAEAADLPSLSQVDMGVFDALPEDVRKELEIEYSRRSITPMLAENPARSHSPSMPVERNQKIIVKGTDVKRITQQLAPRNRPSVSPAKSRLSTKPVGPSSVYVSERELLKLNIDPEVFIMLPPDLQREQLAMARGVKAPGVSLFAERKVLKPKVMSKSPSVPYYRAPPPQAKYVQPPILKQQGKTKGDKLYFTETEDIERVIEAWVDGFREHPPNQRDVDYFAKFLVQCVDGTKSTDTGIEKATMVLRWWLVLLRRYFGIWEHASNDGVPDTGGEVTSEVVGRAWWKAFREVKQKMDVVARKKFGGCLSLR